MNETLPPVAVAAAPSRFDRDAKARADLGWDALVAELAARCHTSRGAAAARSLALSVDAGWIRTRLAEVTEARAMHDVGEPMPFGAIHDIEPALERADNGGHLEGGALREVADTLAAAARLRRHLAARVQAAPRLAGRASLIAPLDQVFGPIAESFDDAGRLLDSASPSLGGLRRKAAALHEELARKSRALLEDPRIAPHLQDHFYTQRDERYVIPVRVDSRTRVPGIVHGTSGSGQTVFVEPEEIVDLNNRLKLAELEVAEEERRILGELTLLVKDAIDPIRVNLEVLAVLDLIDGSARLAIDTSSREPSIAEPAVDGDAKLDLRNARHPLMVLAGKTCVPNDIVLGRGQTLVVSGPNAGGKTVALKTAGLLSLMVRAGLHLPTQEGSSLPLFERVLTDVGDDQSLERNLSTFSAHVLHLNEFLAAADASALILLDEVAVGTDPEQGAALAQAVLEALAARGATVIVTTHYDRLKALAARDAPFLNASVGFDLQALAPTYKLHLGVPGASGAIVVARRLGLPAPIAARANELFGTRAQGTEELLRLVDNERRRLAAAAEAAEAERRAAEAERQRAERLVTEAQERLRDARKGAHDEAVDALKRARMEFDRVRVVLKRAADRGSSEALTAAGKQLDEAARAMAEHAPAREPATGATPAPSDLSVGMEVLVPRLGGRGVVTSIAPGKIAVQVGALKLTVAADELRVPEGKGTPAPRPRFGKSDEERLAKAEAVAPRALPRTSGNTLDLRGERVDVACALAEKFVDDALRAGQDAVYLVHGHGTGALRNRLREHFGRFPRVAELRPGSESEGGDGVTVLLLD